MDFLYHDIETYSAVPGGIRAGTYRYAEHESTEVMLWQWALHDGDVGVWDRYSGEPMPEDLAEYLAEPRIMLVAHESTFDRTVLRHKMPELVLPLERWWDTAAQARAHSLPGGLDKLCKILNIGAEDAKHAGKDLIKFFCSPKKGKRNLPEDHVEQWWDFIEYSKSDIRAMRQVHKRLPRWNYGGGYRGRAMWMVEQRANDRGFHVDVQLAQQAVETVERVRADLNARTNEMTGGAVEKATQRDRLLEHLLGEWGISLPDMKAATIERRLEDENLPDHVKELLAIRLQASTASVAKYKALVKSVTADQRLHGTMLYCGAQRTGRRSGRTFQPQNLSRVPKYFPGSKVKAQDEYDLIAEAIREGCLDLLAQDPMETMGYMVRAAIDAPPGRKLNVADLSNIEGRMMAYLAGEEWRLQAFRDLDAGRSPYDLYVLSYAKSFHVDPAVVQKDYEDGGVMRQIGKIEELSLQYWGGWRAFSKMGAVYGLEMDKERATEIVKGWRAANQAVMNFSGNLEKAARKAILAPGTTHKVGLITLRRDGAWLRVRLPSGRCLCYPHPEVDAESGNISYMGINIYTKQWERIGTYGGKLGENVTQAASADYMMENEVLIEDAGYDIVLDVHDEVVTETEDSEQFSGKDLGRLLATPRPWSQGMPCVSSGFSTYRYRKG